jgi:hypothetical protein
MTGVTFFFPEVAFMKTLAIILAVVVVAGAGAVGGYDYATKGDLGILPASWTSCDACCTDCCSGCSLCDSSTDATSVKLTETEATEDSCADCASCCPGSKAKAVTVEAEARSQQAATDK